jgi:hypothetical protein
MEWEMKIMKTQGAVKPLNSDELIKRDTIVINGKAYERRWKKGDGSGHWLLSGQGGDSANVHPETDRWIDRKWMKRRNVNRPIVVRFPRLKRKEELFDGANLTWKNAPRFDPEKSDDTKWLIDYFIADKSINLIYAPAGSFKSSLMLYASKCVAGGNDFLGIKTLQRRVLYLDYENPAHVLKTRTFRRINI